MKKWLLPLIAVAVLAALFVWMRPAPPVVAVALPIPASVAPSLPATPAAPVEQRFELVVKDKKLLSGPAVLSVPQGTTITLGITSDHDDELHLHGYDLSLPLQANVRGELHFVANQSGRFEYELHHAHLDLGALEVQPQ